MHGLNGGPSKTWKHDGTDVIWFRDLLPDYLRNHGNGANARIWTYGYNAHLAFGSAKAGAFDFAHDLLSRVRAVRRGFEVGG